jgi:hypothetical protein
MEPFGDSAVVLLEEAMMDLGFMGPQDAMFPISYTMIHPVTTNLLMLDVYQHGDKK